MAIFNNQPTISRAQKYKIYSQDYYSSVFEKAHPWQLAIAHEIYRFADARGRKAYRELDSEDPYRNILNYGVFHICRISWWVLVNEYNADPKDPNALMEIIRKGDEGLLNDAYERAKSLMFEIA